MSATSERSLAGDVGREPHRYWRYGVVISVFLISLSLFGPLNAYFHLYTIASYNSPHQRIPLPHLLEGYVGIFVSLLILPIPDYVLLPLYGYLSSIGVFNPVTVFSVSLLGTLIPIEYLAGRFAGRPLLLKALSYVRIRERDIEVADRWLMDHGKFSIFIATFIPFFYSGASHWVLNLIWYGTAEI